MSRKHLLRFSSTTPAPVAQSQSLPPTDPIRAAREQEAEEAFVGKIAAKASSQPPKPEADEEVPRGSSDMALRGDPASFVQPEYVPTTGNFHRR